MFQFKSITENEFEYSSKTDLLANIGCPIKNKQEVLRYLKREANAVTTWLDKDVIKGDVIASDYNLPAYDDGEFAWTGLEIFYFEKYDLKLSKEFLAKVRSLADIGFL